MLVYIVCLPVQAFEPLSVQLSDPLETSTIDTHTLQFQVPHQHHHSRVQLGILAIAVNGKLASVTIMYPPLSLHLTYP